MTHSEKAEDWENACHELIWLAGDHELFEKISNAAQMNAKQRHFAESSKAKTLTNHTHRKKLHDSWRACQRSMGS